MIKHLLFLSPALIVLMHGALADSSCEKRLAATKMVSSLSELKALCNTNPSGDVQDCMSDILVKSKGKLREKDFLEVYAVCKVDPRKIVRDCMVKGLDKKWDDKGYRGAKFVGTDCLAARLKPSAASRARQIQKK
jgi:hypothetical protein